MTVIKWISIPALLVVALFSYLTAGYEFLLDFAVCLGAVFFIQKAIGLKQYFWAAGFVGIALVFSPLTLVLRIFLLMGWVSVTIFAALFAAFRPQPLTAKASL